MTIDDLLEFWARWSSGLSTRDLGYAASRFNLLMARGSLTPRGDCAFSQLPYGMDGESTGSIIDRQICRLTPQQRRAVVLEYCYLGIQADKAKSMKPPISQSAFACHLRNAKTRLSMQPDIQRLMWT